MCSLYSGLYMESLYRLFRFNSQFSTPDRFILGTVRCLYRKLAKTGKDLYNFIFRKRGIKQLSKDEIDHLILELKLKASDEYLKDFNSPLKIFPKNYGKGLYICTKKKIGDSCDSYIPSTKTLKNKGNYYYWNDGRPFWKQYG